MPSNDHDTLVEAPPALRVLFARDPGWEFSLMLTLLVISLFIAVRPLCVGKTERNLVTFLQFVLATISLLARSAGS